MFVAFPNEATFADCKGGEIAQVLTDNVMLPDYDFIPGHEFTSSLYRTDAKQWRDLFGHQMHVLVPAEGRK